MELRYWAPQNCGPSSGDRHPAHSLVFRTRRNCILIYTYEVSSKWGSNAPRSTHSPVSPSTSPFWIGLSLYLLSPSSRITAWICLIIRDIHCWMRFWDKFFHHLVHAVTACFLTLCATRFVVSIFISIQQGLIMFKSGEFPGQRSRITWRIS